MQHAGFRDSSWSALRLALYALSSNYGIRLLHEYQKFAANLLKNHGWDVTVKVLKDLQTRVNRASIGQKSTGNSLGGIWFNIGPNGIPSKLPIMSKVVKVEPFLANTVASFVRLLRTKPSLDITTIVSGSLQTEFLHDWLQFAKWCKDHVSPVTVIPLPQWHTSIKASAAGPAAIIYSGVEAKRMLSSKQHLDRFIAMCYEVGMYELAWNLVFLLNDMRSSANYSDNEGRLAKLSFLSDKAGKTRVVYILNYWHQELLLPLHNAMMNWLKVQPQDGTYDQQRAVETVKSWSKEGIPLFCYDLTAATDRWPAMHQYLVVRALAGSKWANTWFEILTTVLAVNKFGTTAYAVGQPMGAYASWAALSVTHHLLIRYLASLHGVEPKYVVLGDDVVIACSTLAKAYEQYLTNLGVTISQGKSVTPQMKMEGYNQVSAEFAKRLISGGRDLSPISPQLVEDVYHNHLWWKMLDIINETGREGGIGILITPSTIYVSPLLDRLLNVLPKEQAKLIVGMISNTWTVNLANRDKLTDDLAIGPDAMVPYPNPWKGIDDLTFLHFWGEVVADQLVQKSNELLKLKEAIGPMGKLGDPGDMGDLAMLGSAYHPVQLTLRKLDDSLRSCYETVSRGEQPKDAIKFMMDADCLIQVVAKGVDIRDWKRSKDRKQKLIATLTWKVHKAILASKEVVMTDCWE